MTDLNREARRAGPAWRRLRLWGPVWLYMAVVFALSAQSTLPTPPGHLSDKHWHAMEYAGLSTLACRAMSGGALTRLAPGPALAGWAIAAAYGGFDEFHQWFVPGRDSDVLDVAADAAGATAAALGFWAWGIIARSRRERGSLAPPA